AGPEVQGRRVRALFRAAGTGEGGGRGRGGRGGPRWGGGAHKVAAYPYGIGAELGLWERLMDAAPESWRRAREIVDAAARNLGGEFEPYKAEGKSYGRMVRGGTLSR